MTVSPGYGARSERDQRERAHDIRAGLPGQARQARVMTASMLYGPLCSLDQLHRRIAQTGRSPYVLALATTATGAAAASAYLTWEQAARLRAWCFWCLTSAAINVTVLALSLLDARGPSSPARRRR